MRIAKLCLLSGIAAVLVLGGAYPAAALKVKVGDKFPMLTIENAAHKAVPLAKVMNGKPSLVVYWSVSCSACVEEVPKLLAHYNKKKNQKYRLILVAGEAPEMITVAKCFVEAKNPGPAVVLFDRLTRKGHILAETLGLEYTPTLVIVGAGGKISTIFEGAPRTMAKLDEALAKVVK
jgi:thiol-disulfide isomerase/thioredoxin